MPKQSAGILLYHIADGSARVLLVHPGGPFYRKKDAGHWSIPKGEFLPGEDPLATAKKEFHEEIGTELIGEDFTELQPIKQKAGKTVYAWAVKAYTDVTKISSNSFETEWPPKSGKRVQFPEVDKAQWFGLEEAKLKINSAQVSFITQLEELL